MRLFQIINEIQQHKIKIYEFPEDESDATSNKLRQRVPFAVVGSNVVSEGEGGKKVRGRKYPWGFVEGEEWSVLACSVPSLHCGLYFVSSVHCGLKHIHLIFYESNLVLYFSFKFYMDVFQAAMHQIFIARISKQRENAGYLYHCASLTISSVFSQSYISVP